MAGSGFMKVSHYAEPASLGLAVTPSDSTELAIKLGDFPRSLYVGVAGNLTVIMRDDDTNTPVLVPNAPVGYHPLRVKKVMNTGTAASGIVAWW